MSELPPSSRPKRSRSTSPVLSDAPTVERWWADRQRPKTPTYNPQPVMEHPEVMFPSSDPLDRVGRVRYGVVILALLLPVLFVSRIDSVRSSVARQFSNPKKLGTEQFAKGDLMAAIAPLRIAAAEHPNDVVLLRQLAISTAGVSPAESRRYFNRLEKLGSTTDADRAHHGMLLARLQDLTGAKALLAKISPQNRSSALTQQAWLEVWKSAGDFAAAADVIEKMFAANSEADISICLDVVEAAKRSPIAPETLERLENLAAKALGQMIKEGKDTAVLAVAPRLASLNWHSTSSRLDVAKALRALPGNPPEYRMAAVRMGFPAMLDGADRKALRVAWLEEVGNAGGYSAEDKEHVVAYLQKQNEHELVADLVPAAEAVTEYPLYLRRIDSLLELGRWREVGAMCAEVGAPSLPQSRMLSQSLAALYKQGPQTCMAERLLMDAFNESREEKRASACFATGCAALDHRLPTLASTAFATALDLSKDRRATMEAIINTSRRGGLGVAQLLRSLDATEALRDDLVQNQLIYLNLLANHEVDAMTQIIRNRQQKTPDDVYLRFLEAYALNLKGNFTQAAHLLVPLPRYRWHQGEAAVLAGIIAAAGNFDRSAGLVSQINTQELFAEERQMVEPWQQRIATGAQLVSKVENSAGGQ